MSHFEDELDKIRIEIYEELKGLSNADSSKLVGERARKIAEQYRIKIIMASLGETSSVVPAVLVSH
jgi:hypothetical protein